MKNGKATATWSIVAELHKFHLASADQITCEANPPLHALVLCSDVPNTAWRWGPALMAEGETFRTPKPSRSGPDCVRFINMLDSKGKLLFGYWLSFVLNPYRHWHFGFAYGRGVPACLAIRYAVWERACRAGWCVGEQFWDVVKAFDMLSRPKLFHDMQATAVWVLMALSSLCNRARMFAAHLWFLTHTRVRQGDSLGPGPFRRSYD